MRLLDASDLQWTVNSDDQSSDSGELEREEGDGGGNGGDGKDNVSLSHARKWVVGSVVWRRAF